MVIYEHGLQPSVDKAIENDPPAETLDAAKIISLAHQTEHEDEEGHEEEGHDHGGLDPHFWLDPTLLARVAGSFTGQMAKADPEHADDFRANNDALQQDLKALDQEFREGLATCETRTLVTSHDAFGYLGRRYNLTVHAIAGLSPDAEPSPKHLAELSDLIRTEDITTVFSERSPARRCPRRSRRTWS